MQGIKVTHGLTPAARDAIWHEIGEQVARQGCALGYFAAPPPLLTQDQAQAEARSEPHVLSSVAVGS